MTYTQFKQKYLNKPVDFDGAFGAQCVDLFRFYVRDVLATPQPKGVTGAADFWTNYETDPNLNQHFAKVSNTPNGVPKQGDVIVWNRKYGPYGHIAIVDSADVNNLTCLSQNDPIGQPTILKNYKYTNIYGWLQPKGNPMSGTVSLDKATFERLVTNSSRWDEVAKMGYSSATQIDQEVTQLKKAASDAKAAQKTEAERAESARKELNHLIAECAKALNTQQEPNQIVAALSKLDKQLDELDDLQQQFASLQLESGKQAEDMRAEIARLEALIKTSGSLSGATFEQLLAEFVRRIKNVLAGRNV